MKDYLSFQGRFSEPPYEDEKDKRILVESSEIQLILDLLKIKSRDKSDYADKILDFFAAQNRFHVNACVYKEMDKELVKYCQARANEMLLGDSYSGCTGGD